MDFKCYRFREKKYIKDLVVTHALMLFFRVVIWYLNWKTLFLWTELWFTHSNTFKNVWQTAFDCTRSTNSDCLAVSLNIVRCRYNVNFLQNSHNRQPIGRSWWRDMGCLSWIWNVNYVLLLSSQCRLSYRDKLDRVIAALDCVLKWMRNCSYM